MARLAKFSTWFSQPPIDEPLFVEYAVPIYCHNVAIGSGAAFDMFEGSRCTIIGPNVPGPDADDIIRIGSGNVYLEMGPGFARIVGAEPDEATKAVIEGIAHAADWIVTTFRRARSQYDATPLDTKEGE